MRDDASDVDFELPEIFAISSVPGPVVSILGGVHGDEAEGVLAAAVLRRRLADELIAGTVRFASPAHPSAWQAFQRASPVDGLNLARAFPGRPDGSATERIARHLTDELVTGSDLLIDLHSAGANFDMPLLVGYHSEGPLSERASKAAVAFGGPVLWKHPEVSPGRSLDAAEAQGVPSIYVEGRGGHQVRAEDLGGYVDGVLRVLRSMGMVAAAPVAGASLEVSGDGDTDAGVTSASTGFLVVHCEVGERLSEGGTIAEVIDDTGLLQETIAAPCTGIVMLTRRRVQVEPGDTVALIARVDATIEAKSAR